MVHNDIIRRTKNMMRSPIFSIAISLSILIGVIQTPDRGWVGRLYTFQAGQPYMFQEPINLELLMSWIFPHAFLSILIGKCMEADLQFARFMLPRYTSAFQWWFRLCVATWLLVSVYYIAINAGICMFSILRDGAAVLWISPIRNIHAFTLLWLITGMQVIVMCALTSMQLSFQSLTKISALGVASFLLCMLLSVFFPVKGAEYLPGSWMMIVRSNLVNEYDGYLLWVACALSVLFIGIVIVITYIGYRMRKNYW